jgi:hypothetical protein
MSIEYDLRKMLDVMTDKRHPACFIIKHLLSGTSTLSDLRQSRLTFTEYLKLQDSQVDRIRQGVFDYSEDGTTIGALFICAMNYLCRALDGCSTGRTRIEFSSAFKRANLGDAHILINEFRNNELAHYGGFGLRTGKFSDDQLSLVVETDSKTHFTNNYVRFSGTIELAEIGIALVECASNECQSYIDNKRKIMLNILSQDQALRNFIKQNEEDLQFDKVNFFARLPGFNPGPTFIDGPWLEIQW